MIKKLILSTSLLFSFVQGETITHNGFTYGTVVSPYTGRVWLDRNLGASRVCQSFDDEQCYGDYYQWGRSADGHEKLNSPVTTTQATNVNSVGHGSFIAAGINNNYDWAKDVDSDGSKRSINWGNIYGSYICPAGFRVPNDAELRAETTDQDVNNIYDLFSTFLKVPAAGVRYDASGNYGGGGVFTVLYTTFSATTDGVRVLDFGNTGVSIQNSGRASGCSVRCIRDASYVPPTNQPPVANPGENQTVYEGIDVTLSAANSTDSDGTITNYEWSENGVVLSRDVNFTKDDFDIGVHTITLKVTDNDGLSSEGSVTITVKEAPPLWLTTGLNESFNVIKNEKFYREFNIYANDYYIKEVEYPESTYSTENLQITTNIESLNVECNDWSILTKPLLECKLIGNIEDSSNVILTIYDKKYNMSDKINFDINITSQKIANINDQESYFIITNGILSHTPIISFDILGNNVSQEPECSYIDLDGNIHQLNIKKISDIRYQCDSSRLFDATIVQNDINNSNFTIKITHDDISKEVPVETFIRDEKHANAILQYACEYEYMRADSSDPYVKINNLGFFPISSENCDARMFYLGGDMTDSSRNRDTVELDGGIWKLYIDKHILLIDITDRLSFDVDGGDLLENEQILKFNIEPESKFLMTLKRSLRAVKESFYNITHPVHFEMELADTVAGVRGTTLQVIKDANKNIRYNLIEGIVDIYSEKDDKNTTLTSMQSYDVETGRVNQIVENTLTPLDIQLFRDTKLNDIDINKNIGSINIQTDTIDAQYLLLGLNTQYGMGKETLFDEVAEGNYTIRFLNKLWYKKPDDINIAIDKDHLEHSFSSHYQKLADVYLDDILQNKAIRLDLSSAKIAVIQQDDEHILETIILNDINSSLQFFTTDTTVKVNSDTSTITTNFKLAKEVNVIMIKDGTIKLSAEGLTLPKSLPAGTQSKVVDQSIKFIVPLDQPIKF